MAEKSADSPATPKQLLSVLQDESPSTQYRKRNSLMKDMRNDLFSEFNRLAEDEEKGPSKDEKSTPRSAEEEDEEDDYDESDVDDEDDENGFWSDDDVEQRRPATARRRTASRAPKVGPAETDSQTATEDTAKPPKGSANDVKETTPAPAEGSTTAGVPAPLETSDSYKDTELFRQLEDLKQRRAAAEAAAGAASDSPAAEATSAVVSEAQANATVAREKSTPPLSRRSVEEGTSASTVARADVATVARTPSTFVKTPTALGASLDRPPCEELGAPVLVVSLEEELEMEIEKEIEKIVAEETATSEKERTSSTSAAEKDTDSAEPARQSSQHKFTVKEPSKTGTSSTVKFSKSKHSRAGSDVHAAVPARKKSHRRSRSTGKVQLQVIADATRQQHADDMKKCVDDEALMKRHKTKHKRTASEKKSSKQSSKSKTKEKSKHSEEKTKHSEEKTKHSEEKSKGSEDKSKHSEDKREKSHKTKNKERSTDAEKPKHKAKELLAIDSKAERKAKRSSRTIGAARSIAHKTQQLLGKKDATPDSSQEHLGVQEVEELATAAEAMAAIEAARLAVHKELSSAGVDPVKKKEETDAPGDEDSEQTASVKESDSKGPDVHFLQPRDRSFTQELAIEGAPVVPGADYFLTDSDRALIKEMEEKEARRVAVLQKTPSEGEDAKAKKGLGASQTRTKLRSLLKNLQSEGEEEVEDARAKLLQLQFEHQQVLDAKKAAIALAEGEELSFKDRMRNKTINEVMFSEVDYVDDLSFIITMFHDTMLERSLVTEQQRVAIFSNIDLIFDMHTNLLEKLGKWAQHPDGPEVADCFGELTQYRKLFSDYCNNHANAVHTVESLMRKSATFRQLVEEQQAHPRCNGMPFTSFLIKPVQRICKYPLFLRELVKHTEESNAEYSKLVAVLENFNSVVELINETKREADNMAAITRLQRKLGVKALELLQPGRVFVREGFLQETIKGESAMLLYCLFNDILLRAEKKVKKFGTIRKQEKFILADQLPIYSVSVHSEGTQAFTIECGKKSYRVSAASASERDSWVDAIRAQQKTMFDESNPESHDQARASASTLSPSPTTAVPEVSTPAQTRKVKCYLNKGAENQRIRKVVLNSASSMTELLETIRREFEWEEDRKLTVAYLDEDDDLVEVSNSIDMQEMCSEAKLLQILDSE